MRFEISNFKFPEDRRVDRGAAQRQVVEGVGEEGGVEPVRRRRRTEVAIESHMRFAKELVFGVHFRKDDVPPQ